jgi:hypothetical protein
VTLVHIELQRQQDSSRLTDSAPAAQFDDHGGEESGSGKGKGGGKDD